MKKKLAIIFVFSFFTLCYSPVSLATELTYETGLSKVNEYIKNSHFKEAEALTRTLLTKYPDNRDFETILAKVLFWEEHYDESIIVYQKMLKQEYSSEIQTELDKAKSNLEFNKLTKSKSLINSFDFDQQLHDFYTSGQDTYNRGYMAGAYYIDHRDFVKAEDIFLSLHQSNPDDVNISILYLEALIESKNYTVAKDFYNTLKESDLKYINEKRDDINYRLKRNYALIRGGYYVYPPNFPSEKELTFEVSQDYNNFTFVPHYSNISRFGLNNNQLGVDVYSVLGEKRWGYISATVSPDAVFLPRWTAGVDFYQGIGITEVSLGYTRLNFADLGVNIIRPGVRVYLPYNTAIDEKLNYVPEQQSAMLISTLSYEPNPKFNIHYSLGLGQIGEKISSADDLKKVSTYINTIGLQYRFIPQFAVNAEFTYTHREGLYDIKGASVSTKYMW